jgi:glycosyltransferase involved in cell wall biosynthesis
MYMMKILQVHNRYVNSPGGEDVILENERKLLVERGHQVEQFFVSNTEMNTRRGLSSVQSGLNSIWSWKSFASILRIVKKEKPDIVHVHNTFAVLSPSIFWAIQRAGVPVVLTLHNYRLICATSTLYRDGQPCEECVGKFPLAAVRHRCTYHESFAAGLSIVANQVIHARLGTYSNKVDGIIVYAEWLASVMQQAGIPAGKLYIKPNFVANPFATGEIRPAVANTRYKQIIYVGQIHPVKGVEMLLSAWEKVTHTGYRLLIIGDGPDRVRLQKEFRHASILWLGQLAHNEVMQHIMESRFLTLPSRWYEPFGMTVLEGMSLATPAIVPNHGSFPSFARDGNDAIFFIPNDPVSLQRVLQQAIDMDASLWDKYSRAARQTYLAEFTPERNYEKLIEVYEKVLTKHHRVQSQ